MPIHENFRKPGIALDDGSERRRPGIMWSCTNATTRTDRVPSDKVDAVRTEQRLNPTIMVGDGINDTSAARLGRTR